MLRFVEWAFVVGVELRLPSIPLLFEARGDEGEQAFVERTNEMFRQLIDQLLKAGKFTDDRNKKEAERIVSDHNNMYFNYAQELMRAASGGMAKLGGLDVSIGAQDANGKIWQRIFMPLQARGVTWESLHPMSADRNGIIGTIKSYARNLAGHYAARMFKRRTGVKTIQAGQDPDTPFDPEGRPEMNDMEWEDIKRAVISNISDQLDSMKMAGGSGAHHQARVRNLQWALEIAQRQMEIPWQWRSMPEVMAEIPELAEAGRGGLQQILAKIIQQAKEKAMGEDKQESVQLALEEFRYWIATYKHD